MAGLTAEEVEKFARGGLVAPRGGFARRDAEAMARSTFGHRDPAAGVAERTQAGLCDVRRAGLDVANAATWPGTRVDVESGQRTSTASLRARLLAGPARQAGRSA